MTQHLLLLLFTYVCAIFLHCRRIWYVSRHVELFHTRSDVHLLRYGRSGPSVSEVYMVEEISNKDANSKSAKHCVKSQVVAMLQLSGHKSDRSLPHYAM